MLGKSGSGKNGFFFLTARSFFALFFASVDAKKVQKNTKKASLCSTILSEKSLSI
jgi:hypothetical protein